MKMTKMMQWRNTNRCGLSLFVKTDTANFILPYFVSGISCFLRCRLNEHIQKDAALIICTNNGILSVIVIDLAAAEADVCFQTVLHQLL